MVFSDLPGSVVCCLTLIWGQFHYYLKFFSVPFSLSLLLSVLPFYVWDTFYSCLTALVVLFPFFLQFFFLSPFWIFNLRSFYWPILQLRGSFLSHVQSTHCSHQRDSSFLSQEFWSLILPSWEILEFLGWLHKFQRESQEEKAGRKRRNLRPWGYPLQLLNQVSLDARTKSGFLTDIPSKYPFILRVSLRWIFCHLCLRGLTTSVPNA